MYAKRRFKSACASKTFTGLVSSANDAKFLRADKEDSDQTVIMRKLIWVFVGRICQTVRFLTLWLVWYKTRGSLFFDLPPFIFLVRTASLLPYHKPSRSFKQEEMRFLFIYCRLSLSLSSSHSLKYFKISVHRLIRSDRTNTFHKWIFNLSPEDRDILKILWKRGEAISPLFHNILLLVVRFLC